MYYICRFYELARECLFRLMIFVPAGSLAKCDFKVTPQRPFSIPARGSLIFYKESRIAPGPYAAWGTRVSGIHLRASLSERSMASVKETARHSSATQRASVRGRVDHQPRCAYSGGRLEVSPQKYSASVHANALLSTQ